MRGARDLTNHHRHLNWSHWQNYAIGRKNADNVGQDEALESEEEKRGRELRNVNYQYQCLR